MPATTTCRLGVFPTVSARRRCCVQPCAGTFLRANGRRRTRSATRPSDRSREYHAASRCDCTNLSRSRGGEQIHTALADPSLQRLSATRNTRLRASLRCGARSRMDRAARAGDASHPSHPPEVDSVFQLASSPKDQSERTYARDASGRSGGGRRPARKKRRAKLSRLKEETERRRHHRVAEQHAWLSRALEGRSRSASPFRRAVFIIPGPTNASPSGDPRWEPGAGSPLAGFCPRGGPKGPSLPEQPLSGLRVRSTRAAKPGLGVRSRIPRRTTNSSSGCRRGRCSSGGWRGYFRSGAAGTGLPWGSRRPPSW